MKNTLNAGERKQALNRDWLFAHGMYTPEGEKQARKVQLPHDYLIEQSTGAEAVSGPATGYYDAFPVHYTKRVVIPAAWKGDTVILRFDGAMQHAAVEVNGSLVTLHHYGYTPFDADLSPYLYWGEENRITVTMHPGTQPNSRWYPGAGLYRQVWLYHKPAMQIVQDGVFIVTERLERENGKTAEAFLRAEVTVRNGFAEDRLARTEVTVSPEGEPERKITAAAVTLVKAGGETRVRLRMTVDEPALWDAEHPRLYKAQAEVRDLGVFGIRHEPDSAGGCRDTETVHFGIRTITADARHGLLINGNPVKLKGGCCHHDNGILGAESYRDSEARRIRKLKEIGYNALRTSHNPPSTELLEVCDELGMYVMDEAFDGWRIGKNPGDFSQHFAEDWEKDVEAYVRRDRNHPSVILWSTGNEVTERGGLGDGYALAESIALKFRSMDDSRPVSHALCSFWSGLDDRSMEAVQDEFSWEERTEPLVNALDVIGYNYMDECWERDAERYPSRVIVGTESFPNQMHQVWGRVEKYPHVIGDFTWTAADYIGEAGIGKSIFVDPDDPRKGMGPAAAMNTKAEWPWRLAYDADLDLCGELMPQGVMRKILWGSDETRIFVQDPACFGREELISPWGWEEVSACWNWPGAENREIRVVVYSAAEEVELSLNGEPAGTRRTENNRAEFTVRYAPGTLRASGIRNGAVLSEDVLETTGKETGIRLIPERTAMPADGMSIAYIRVEITDEQGRIVPDSGTTLEAAVSGAGTLAGFGSADPRAKDNYGTGRFAAWRGKALLAVRGGTGDGTAEVTVRAGTTEAHAQIQVGGTAG